MDDGWFGQDPQEINDVESSSDGPFNTKVFAVFIVLVALIYVVALSLHIFLSPQNKEDLSDTDYFL